MKYNIFWERKKFFCSHFASCVFSQRARKFKKVQAKKLVKSNKSKYFFREIAFLAVLNFFPIQKLILAIFEIANREKDLFDFTKEINF